jgi:hypothetical protein
MDGCPKAPRRPVASAMKQLDQASDQIILEVKIAAWKLGLLRDIDLQKLNWNLVSLITSLARNCE